MRRLVCRLSGHREQRVWAGSGFDRSAWHCRRCGRVTAPRANEFADIMRALKRLRDVQRRRQPCEG